MMKHWMIAGLMGATLIGAASANAEPEGRGGRWGTMSGRAAGDTLRQGNARLADSVEQRQTERQERRTNQQDWRQGQRDDRREWRQEPHDGRQNGSNPKPDPNRGWNVGSPRPDNGWRNERRNDRRDDRQDWRQDRRDDRQDWRQDRRDDWRDRRDDRRDNWRHNDNRYIWDRDWRRDQRYDWQRYRKHNRHIYRGPRYYAPSGWGYGYRPFSIGITLWSGLYNDRYWISDPWYYRLPPAHGPLRWVRYYDDALLVDIRTGYVVDVINNFFW